VLIPHLLGQPGQLAGNQHVIHVTAHRPIRTGSPPIPKGPVSSAGRGLPTWTTPGQMRQLLRVAAMELAPGRMTRGRRRGPSLSSAYRALRQAINRVKRKATVSRLPKKAPPFVRSSARGGHTERFSADDRARDRGISPNNRNEHPKPRYPASLGSQSKDTKTKRHVALLPPTQAHFSIRAWVDINSLIHRHWPMPPITIRNRCCQPQ